MTPTDPAPGDRAEAWLTSHHQQPTGAELFASSCQTVDDATAWLPVVQPADPDSLLLAKHGLCNCGRNHLGMATENSGDCPVHPLPGCPNPACGETWVEAFHGDHCDTCGWRGTPPAGWQPPTPPEPLTPLAATLHQRMCTPGCRYGASERSSSGIGWNDLDAEVRAVVLSEHATQQDRGWRWRTWGRYTLAVHIEPKDGAR